MTDMERPFKTPWNRASSPSALSPASLVDAEVFGQLKLSQRSLGAGFSRNYSFSSLWHGTGGRRKIFFYQLCFKKKKKFNVFISLDGGTLLTPISVAGPPLPLNPHKMRWRAAWGTASTQDEPWPHVKRKWQGPKKCMSLTFFIKRWDIRSILLSDTELMQVCWGRSSVQSR